MSSLSLRCMIAVGTLLIRVAAVGTPVELAVLVLLGSRLHRLVLGRCRVAVDVYTTYLKNGSGCPLAPSAGVRCVMYGRTRARDLPGFRASDGRISCVPERRRGPAPWWDAPVPLSRLES